MENTTTTTTILPAEAAAMITEPRIIKMRWKTNINNKLGCNGFLHLDVEPATGMPTDDALEHSVIEISTDDNSHPPTLYKLTDVCPLPAIKVGAGLIMASHGMTPEEYADYLFATQVYYKPGYNGKPTTGLAVKRLAIYYYKKI